MKILLVAAVVSSFAACCQECSNEKAVATAPKKVQQAAPAAEYAPPDEYGLRAANWKLTADAEKLLAEWAKIPYVRKAGRTDFFVRAQLKYGINRRDFLHHWYDRPLLQDSSLGYVNQDVEKGPWLNEKGWQKTVEMGRLGKQTGFAVFTFTKNREEVLPASLKPGAETKILVELATSLPLEDCIYRAKQALDAPNTFRINGKVVLTSYPAIREKNLPFYAKLKQELTARFGDKFLVMPYYMLGLEGRRDTADGYSADVLRKMRERLERALKVLDGLCYNGRESSWNRRYNPWLFDTVFVPLVHAVFSKPEFKEKCLGCWSTPGHENSYRWNYGLDCTGTRMLRDMLASLVKLNPDFMIGCEWDEENENTSFRPMVAHGFTNQRIMRYYHDIANGLKPDMFPGDDASVPNLIVSYRKELMAGEPLEVEVLNIPDGTFDDADITVAFAWKTPDGKVVRSFPPQKLKGGRLAAAWFKEDVSRLIDNPALVPELTVWAKGMRADYSDGLWPVGLRPTRCIEYKWAKHPLRDLPKGTAGTLNIGEPDANGVREIRGSVKSDARLRSIAVIDETDTIYMYDGRSVRDADTVRVRIAFQGYWLNGKGRHLNGRINLTGAPNAKLSMFRTRGNIAIEGTSFVLTGAMANNWPYYLLVEIPRAEAASAVFEADVKDYFKGKVAVADLERDEVVGLPGKKGANLVFTRYLSQERIPDPQMVKSADFSFRLKPGLPNSILRLETIDEKYRVWRSKPFVLGEASGKRVKFHVFERDSEKVSEISADASRFLDVRYEFAPSRGSVIPCPGGRNLWGILGGNVPLVTGFGQGETGYGNSAVLALNVKTPNWEKSSPDFVKEQDGSWALKFSGCSYVSLPQQIWPVHAGFELEMEVNPDDVKRKQYLVFTGTTSASIYVADGRVYAHFFLRNKFMRVSGRAASVTVKGPEIAAGKWQKVKLVCDQRTAHVEVDGVRGEAMPVSGDLFYPLYTAVGGGAKGGEFFAGRIRNLKIGVR